MMPIRWKPQKLSEVCHIVFEDCHDYSWIQHTVVTAKFDVSYWLIHENRLLTNILLNLFHIKHRILCLRLQLLLLFGFVAPLLLLYLDIIFLLWILWRNSRWRLLTLISGRIDYLYLIEQLTILLVFHLRGVILSLSVGTSFGRYLTHVLWLDILIRHLLLLLWNCRTFIFKDTSAILLRDCTSQIICIR